MPDPSSKNIYELGAFSAEDMLNEIIDLRGRIIQAWRERAIMLTKDEQAKLIQEIRLTCEMLDALSH